MTRYLAALFALLLVAAGIEGFRFLVSGTGSANDQVVFQVPPGKSFQQIANQLHKDGLVTSAFELRVLAKFTGYDSRMKHGEYALNKGMTPQEILAVLASGKSIMYPVTFPEGSNIYEMAALLESRNFYKAEEFLKACQDKALIQQLLGTDVSSFEGYLFPETYHVTRFTPMKELIANMVQNFKSAFGEAENAARAAGVPPLLSRHETVILASMVEKETGAPVERPMIASVFYNRLRKNMKLQSDPTIIYGIWVDTGSYKQNLTRDDITRPTRYNTYTVPRLPFGPIANPGREALAAAMNPARSEYLYFVSHNDGTHAFTKTYEEHARAVKAFQLNPAAREGKSWRDLNKRMKLAD